MSAFVRCATYIVLIDGPVGVDEVNESQGHGEQAEQQVGHGQVNDEDVTSGAKDLEKVDTSISHTNLLPTKIAYYLVSDRGANDGNILH